MNGRKILQYEISDKTDISGKIMFFFLVYNFTLIFKRERGEDILGISCPFLLPIRRASTHGENYRDGEKEREKGRLLSFVWIIRKPQTEDFIIPWSHSENHQETQKKKRKLNRKDGRGRSVPRRSAIERGDPALQNLPRSRVRELQGLGSSLCLFRNCQGKSIDTESHSFWRKFHVGSLRKHPDRFLFPTCSLHSVRSQGLHTAVVRREGRHGLWNMSAGNPKNYKSFFSSVVRKSSLVYVSQFCRIVGLVLSWIFFPDY